MLGAKDFDCNSILGGQDCLDDVWSYFILILRLEAHCIILHIPGGVLDDERCLAQWRCHEVCMLGVLCSYLAGHGLVGAGDLRVLI